MADRFFEAQKAILVATNNLYDMSEFVPTLMIDTVLDMTKINQEFM
ncbi:MAG: hypothetical protein WCK88_02325 [bacterium]